MINFYFLYYFVLVLITIFSYGLLDANFPVSIFSGLASLIREERTAATTVYVILTAILFAFYFKFLKMAKKKELSSKKIFKIIITSIILLLFSYPAFSYDIFNYIATAKVAFFYGENPYIVMPIELTGESMLNFMHAANKTALYGPSWIILTFLPFILGLNNLLLTIFTFKLFIAIFYLGTCFLIWYLSKKNVYSLVFFALNPLVLIETLVSSHNDVVMIFFALLSFYLLKKKYYIFSFLALLSSILIKYATIILVPVYCYLIFTHYRKKTINWQKIWFYSFLFTFFIFFLSPLREEIYAWYFIWPLTFIALYAKSIYFLIFVVSFSFGLEMRFAPFLYFREWGGMTPLIKKIVTFTPLIFSGFLFGFVKKWQKRQIS